MSERITSVGAPGVTGFAENGRKTRAEMIRIYRDGYQRQLENAQRALAVPDEDIKVHTYLGVWAQRNKQEVTE